jgi:membrane protease YdiL (CAAX protease family)
MGSGVADALQALSLAFVFGVIVLAVVDHLVLGMRTAAAGGRGPHACFSRRQPVVRALAPFVAAWAGSQVLALVVFLVLGDTDRGVGSAVVHLFYGLGFLFLGVAGWLWCLRAGMPALPLLWRARHPGRAGVLARVATRHPVLWFGALLAVPIAVTALIVWQGAAGVHPRLAQRLGVASHGTAANVFYLLHLLVSAAIAEEVLFRHYALPRIAATLRHWGAPRRGAAVLAVAITALFFAAGHAGMLESFAPKFAQILVLGISLGTAQVLMGTEAAIAMHILFNLAAGVIGLLA